MHLKNVLVTATKRMETIFFAHMRIALFISFLQHLLRAYQPWIINMLTIVLFINLLCLAERIWDVQIKTMIYWPIETQCVFVLSRLTIISIVILIILIILRLLFL